MVTSGKCWEVHLTCFCCMMSAPDAWLVFGEFSSDGQVTVAKYMKLGKSHPLYSCDSQSALSCMHAERDNP